MAYFFSFLIFQISHLLLNKTKIFFTSLLHAFILKPVTNILPFCSSERQVLLQGISLFYQPFLFTGNGWFIPIVGIISKNNCLQHKKTVYWRKVYGKKTKETMV